MKTGFTILILLGAIWLAAPCVEAQKIVEVFQIDRRVSPPARATYYDLIAKVLPDARVRERNGKNAISQVSKSITDIEAQISSRHENLFGRYGKTIYLGAMTLERAQSMRVQTASGERLLLLLSIAPRRDAQQKDDNLVVPIEGSRPPENAAILALFSIAPQVKLLDVANVKRDAGESSEVFFSDSFLSLRVAARQDAFFIVNRPFEPKRYVLNYALLTVEKDRLKILSEEAFSEIEANGCESRTKAKSRVSLGRRTKARYQTIQIRQLLTFDTFTSSCRKLIKRDLLSVISAMRWDDTAKRYVIKEISSRQTNVYQSKSKRKKMLPRINHQSG